MFTLISVHFFDSSMDCLIEKIRKHIIRNKHIFVCVTNLYGLIEAQEHPRLLRILNKARFTVPDGMPIVWLGKILKRSDVKRIYGPDLMLKVCEMAEYNNMSIFLFGTTNNTLTLLSLNLKHRFPKLVIAGTYAPPFHLLTDKENKHIYAYINQSHAQIVFVGLGTPKQDQWMDRARDHLSANVSIGVGAAFDFFAGTKKQAPRWIGKIGFEWLFRLVSEPKRLGKRYVKIFCALPQLLVTIVLRKLKTNFFV